MSAEADWAVAEPEAPPADTGAAESAEESAAESYSPDDSWATPQAVGDKAERELYEYETQTMAASDAELQHQADVQNFPDLSEEQIADLDGPPRSSPESSLL